MTKSKMSLVGLLLVLMMLVMVSCNQKDESENGANEVTKEEPTEAVDKSDAEALLEFEGNLSFISADLEFEVAYNEIYKMNSMITDVKHISSSGEESNNTVEGVSLESILETQGLSKMDYTGIRFTAGDGYAITVPADVFGDRDVLLAYKFDGEMLDAKKMPLRVAMNDVRSMYFVSNVVSVELLNEVEVTMGADSKLVMLETITGSIDTEEFMYYDSNDTAVKVADILTMVPATGSSVAFVATDGYAKDEAMEVVADGFIKINGEDAPLFTGLDLQKGMNVKSILTMVIGDTTFVSIASAVETNETMVIDDNEGVKLSKVIKMAGLEGDFYVLTAADGYSVEVTADSTKDAIAYVRNAGTITVKFDTQYPKNTKVKDLLTITVGDGSMTEMVVLEASEEAEDKDDSSSKEETEDLWTITFSGLSDGSFDFGSGRAERKLDLVDLHTKRTKDDQVKEDDWQGYKVNDILSFLKVEDYTSITIVAGDGYSIDLMKDQVDDETILAISRNGEALSEADNMVQLVQNTEFATTWIKGVVTIQVNN